MGAFPASETLGGKVLSKSETIFIYYPQTVNYKNIA